MNDSATVRQARTTTLFVVALATIGLAPALAQGGFLGRGPDGAGPPQPPPIRSERPMTVADVPSDLLATALRLGAPQAKQIKTIEAGLERVRPAPPMPGQAPPDSQAMQADGDRFDAQRMAACRRIEALLTADQQRRLAPLLSALNDCRTLHIPLEATSSLHLTSTQQAALSALARQVRAQRSAIRKDGQDFNSVREDMDNLRHDTDRKVRAILTRAQNAAVDASRQNVAPGGPPFFDGPPPGPPPGGGPGPSMDVGPPDGGGGGPGDDGAPPPDMGPPPGGPGGN
ncbi:MAG: hypothetical protein ACLQVD_10420 [Capsulimonadaceae bacterium]